MLSMSVSAKSVTAGQDGYALRVALPTLPLGTRSGVLGRLMTGAFRALRPMVDVRRTGAGPLL